MRTVIQLLDEAVRAFGDRAYLTGKTDSGWKDTSFREADRISDELASWWLKMNFDRGSRVGLIAEGRPEWVIAELSLLKAGLVSVPMSLKLQPEEIPFRLNHSEAFAVVVSRITLPKLLATWNQVENKPFLVILDDLADEERTVLADLKLESGEHWICWSDMTAAGAEMFAAAPESVGDSKNAIGEDDTVNICYTSGTTGNPKGIMLTHLNYWANATVAVEHFGLPTGVFETLVILPLDHSFAHTVATYAGLARAITLSFVDAREGALSILRNIPVNLKERSPQFILTVPAITGNFMKKISEGVAAKGSFINGIFTRGIRAGVALVGDGFGKPSIGVRLRYGFAHRLAKTLVFSKTKTVFGDNILYCVGGGAILEVKQQEFYAAMGVPIYQGYGLTEAAPIISANTPDCHKFGTSGMVMPGIECRIMKTDNEESAPGEKGQIVIRGENVMKGYFKNPEASAEVLRDGWLWTGDLGYFEEDGFLMVVGREKALLIASDGEKYPPEEIEEVIVSRTGVFNQIMVYNDQKKYTTALVTLEEGVCKALFKEKGVTSAESALDVLMSEFDAYRDADDGGKTIPPAWRPAVFEVIPKAFSEDNQLVNSTMKLVRHKVVDFYSGRIDAMYSDLNVKNERNIDAMKELFGLK
ncbi:MAG: AMP-binding protein [Spirochaetaceae bacterium]|nr:AMP-binding protein [Spirochaetaceae bacterium]